MKISNILLVVFSLISLTVGAQELQNLNQVSPFHEGLAAIKKDNQWAFINTDGEIVINFRNDLVPGQCNMDCCIEDPSVTYPFFKDGRALIKENRDGIIHYGYINTSGEIAIKPDFINATHFSKNLAIVLKVYKENLGKNELLGKNMVSYSYNKVIIDINGEVKTHLSGPFNLIYSKDKLKTPPLIASKVLNNNLVATKTKANTWNIKVIDQ